MMNILLTDRATGKQEIVSFAWARIQIEKMYAAPETLLAQIKAGIPLVTSNWVYELVHAPGITANKVGE